MELTCALVLLIGGLATASPYGYGTKGGVAKADARAVAGAYTGVGNVPISIPSGAGYSGSFSQSSSSSSASSSASSSSSSFSYSGSGAAGGVIPGTTGCGSANCNGGGAIGSQGSDAIGSQTSSHHLGTLAGGYGGKIPTSSYGHKYGSSGSQANEGQDCGSEGCKRTDDSGSLNGNGAGTSSQSGSDAKAAGAEHLASSDCGGPDCKDLSGADIKCTSGHCGSETGGTPSTYGSEGKCTSGQCGPNQDSEGNTSIDYENNDINVSTSKTSNPKTSYGASGSGCSNGNCGPSPAPGSLTTSGYSKPATDLIAPKLESACSSPNCQNSPNNSPTGYNSPNTFENPISHGNNPSCNGGACGYSQTKAPYTSTSSENVNQINKAPFPSYGGLSKPSYSHGSSPSYSPVKPFGTNCAPGTPNCDITASTGSSECTSGNCGSNPSAPGYGVSSSIRPSYPYENSPYSPANPSSPACTPGTPGCSPTQSASELSGCASGNCGVHPTSAGYGGASNTKPSYFHGNSPSYSTVNPSGPVCVPGSPGCSPSPSASVPNGCASGNCGAYPTSTSYGSIKPSYSQNSSPSYTPVKLPGQTCAPGTPGCGTVPSASGPSDCALGNCGSYPSAPGYGGSSIIKPNIAYGSSPTYSPVKPFGPACSPSTPGCGTAPSALGYGGPSNIKPSYSHGSSPSYFQVKPEGSDCAPGTPGCGIGFSAGPYECASGKCGAYPSAPGYGGSSNTKPSYSFGSSPSYSPVNPSSVACIPGTPGCPIPSSNSPSNCASGNCGEYPSSAGYGGSSSIKPNYSHEVAPSFSSVKPSGPGCAPGTPGCAILPSASSHSDCASGNCGSNPSSQGCAPGTPGCSGITSTIHSGPSGFQSPHPISGSGSPILTSGVPPYGGSSSLPLPGTQTSTEISSPGYGASGAGFALNQGSFGSHGTGSIQTSYNKPSTGFPTGSSGSGAYTPLAPTASGTAPGIGSPSQTSNVGAIDGSSAQQGPKENLPAYSGGFGGPAGILKPNSFSAPTSSYGHKPELSTGPSKPACSSGICDQSAVVSPSHAHSGSISGAQAIAGASASANAVAYTGGFGGPPGFLKPYDSGKVDHKGPTGKQLTGSSLGLQQGAGGSGIHSNGGSQVGANAIAQANAAAISTTGVSGGDNGHGHDGAGGCGGGCGGSAGNNLGYSRSLGHSNAGSLDNSSHGLATAGAAAAAKSVASASSGAGAYGGSYSSSSAHATSGASVKGGYGRR